jgi:uncharacterized membrane protein YgaE (UPF0421/DUF939 family)
VIGQCAVSAGVAWFIAADLLGHHEPFFAPIAAVVALGTSYGQRLRRVMEVGLGVAVGVFVADLLVLGIGSGAWQMALIVGLALSAALLLDASALFVTQAAVQSIVIASLVPAPGEALLRWTDALIGLAVALVAATLVPSAPLRRPREQAAAVTRKIAELLRAAGGAMLFGQPQPALDVLADARSTDRMIDELQVDADEGMSVFSSSPFRIRHKEGVQRMIHLAEPLDRALRNTRVLVRHTAAAAYHGRPVPRSYAALVRELAQAVDVLAEEMTTDRPAEPGSTAEASRSALLAVGERTGSIERSEEMSAVAILASVRAIIADLLMVTGYGQFEATDALPPPP